MTPLELFLLVACGILLLGVVAFSWGIVVLVNALGRFFSD